MACTSQSRVSDYKLPVPTVVEVLGNINLVCSITQAHRTQILAPNLLNVIDGLN